MSSKISHRVPFPPLGEGYYFFFSMQDISALEDIYGEGNYFEAIERNINGASAKTTLNCIRYGLKKDGQPAQINTSGELGFEISAMGPVIMDALAYAMSGMSYPDLLAEAERRLAERQARVQSQTAKELARISQEKNEDPFAASVASSDSKPTDSQQG